MRASDFSFRILAVLFFGTLLQLAVATRVDGADNHHGSVSRLRRVRRQTPGACTNGFVTDSSGTSCVCPRLWYTTLDGTGCVSACPTGNYGVRGPAPSYVGPCLACPSPFATCSSATRPLSCISGYDFTGYRCLQTCTSSQFTNFTTNACVDCPATWATCANLQRPTTCISGYTLSGYRCLQTCTSSQFTNYTTNQCVDCPPTWATCNNLVQPLSCIPGYNLSGYRCLPACSGAQFINYNTNQCSPCPDANAATCNNLVPLTCKENFTMIGRVCVPLVTSCPVGKYLNRNACLNCRDVKALTCTASVALTCSTGYSLVAGRCRASLTGCGDEAKFVNTTTNTCQSCTDRYASSCTATEATGCVNKFSLIDGKCQYTLTGCSYLPKYLDTATNTCKNCTDPLAYSCTATATTKCISRHTIMANGLCSINLRTCGEAPQFVNTTTNLCQNCPDPNAAHCYVDKSTECFVGWWLNKALGVCEPALSLCENTAQFVNTTSNVCVDCEVPLATSCDMNGATSCQASFSPTNGTCETTLREADCAASQYVNMTANACADCVAPALSCNMLDGSMQIESCDTGFSLVGGDCQTTLSSDSCASNQYLDVADNVCASCPTNALTCTSSGASTCEEGFSLINDACEATLTAEDCAANEYLDTPNNTCVGCAAHATSCTSTAATGCETGYTLSSGSCVAILTSCADDQFLDGPNNACVDCAENTATCSSATVALSCASGFALVGGACEASATCSENQYLNTATNTCVNCTGNAATCTSTAALSCSSGFALVGGACQATATCASNQYLNTATNTCVNCSSNALTCSSTAALTCASGFTLISGACQANVTCATNQYRNTATNVCVNCSSNALTCSSTAALTCASGFTLISGACQANVTCAARQYRNTTTNTCVNCTANTLTCDASGSLTCSLLYTPINGSCQLIVICPLFQTVNLLTNTCS